MSYENNVFNSPARLLLGDFKLSNSPQRSRYNTFLQNNPFQNNNRTICSDGAESAKAYRIKSSVIVVVVLGGKARRVPGPNKRTQQSGTEPSRIVPWAESVRPPSMVWMSGEMFADIFEPFIIVLVLAVEREFSHCWWSSLARQRKVPPAAAAAELPFSFQSPYCRENLHLSFFFCVLPFLLKEFH